MGQAGTRESRDAALSAAPRPLRARPGRRPEGTTRLGRYLRRLRQRHGYTLRHVEQRSIALGTAIDNSQLSRFEKGKAVPSFDKLRALARVFDVAVQEFSDLLDLERYERFKPELSDFDKLMQQGSQWLARGEYGRAFVTFERALEVACEESGSARAGDRAVEARRRMATALQGLGKPYMTERELREILREPLKNGARPRRRALLQLSHLYRDLGDLYLASVLCRECLELARGDGDRLAEARALNTLGEVHLERGKTAAALDAFRGGARLLDGIEGQQRLRIRVSCNLGGGLVAAGHEDEGLRLLALSYQQARAAGWARMAALARSRSGAAFRARGERERARQMLIDSDALLSPARATHREILFANAFQRWLMAREEGSDERQRVALARLRRLRIVLPRRTVEVEQFDRLLDGDDVGSSAPR